MRKNIEQTLTANDYDEQCRTRSVITALDRDKMFEVNFYSDGSGVSFKYYPPTINHGFPYIVASSFSTEQAMIMLAGQRLRSNR